MGLNFEASGCTIIMERRVVISSIIFPLPAQDHVACWLENNGSFPPRGETGPARERKIEQRAREPREAALGINQRLEEVRLERESSDGDDRLHKRLERESLRGSVRGPGCLTSLPCPEKCVAGWGAFNFPRSSRRCSTPGLDPERNLGPFSSPFYLNNFQNGVSAKNFDVPTGPLCNSPSIFGKVSMYKIFVNSKRCNLCIRPSFFERTFSRKDATLPRTNAGSSCLGELAAIRKAAFSTGSFDI